MSAALVNNKVVLVTGATDGIGQAAALELARQGWRVLLHGRDPVRAQAAADLIRRETGSRHVEVYLADFSSLAQVRALATEILQKHDRLDALVNNAGIFMSERVLTPDGVETTFQVNHLAPFLLTLLLRDVLVYSAPARVINVSSRLHETARLDWDNLQSERGYTGQAAYALSKLGNVLFTYALARRLAGQDVTANCLHPGGVATKLMRAGWRPGGISPEQGADTIVWLASSLEVEAVTGEYFINRSSEPSLPVTYDRAVQDRFWQVSAGLVGIETG